MSGKEDGLDTRELPWGDGTVPSERMGWESQTKSRELFQVVGLTHVY